MFGGQILRLRPPVAGAEDDAGGQFSRGWRVAGR